MTEKKNIELRSEKVRNIIGQVPSVLLRYGMALIGVVLLLLVGIAAFIPYQENLPISAVVHTSPQSILLKASQSGHMLWDLKSRIVKKGETLGYEQSRDSLFAIISSLSGKLLYIVQNGDTITKGMPLAIIIPQDDLAYYALAKVPKSLLSKVKQGQKVLFNSSQGTIIGIITSQTPILAENNTVSIRIVFEEKLPQIITAKSILQGKLIISEQSFLWRFFDSLKMN